MIGKINLIISLAYMYVLAMIGTLMLAEGVKEIDRARKKIFLKKKLHFALKIGVYLGKDIGVVQFQ